MPQVTVGLMPNKVSYFCPETRINLTLQNPYATAFYETPQQIKGIVKSLLSSTPTLIYYDGEIPEEAVQAYVDTFAAANKKGKDRFVRDHATNLERAVPSNNVSVRAEKLLAVVAERNGGVVAGASVSSYVPPAPAKQDTTPVEPVEAEAKVEEEKTSTKKASTKKTTEKTEEPVSE